MMLRNGVFGKNSCFFFCSYVHFSYLYSAKMFYKPLERALKLKL